MKGTGHDLSFDHTKLDYQALQRTATIAVGKCLSAIERCIGEMHGLDRNKNYASISQRLLVSAGELNIAAETMYALTQGLTRNGLEIINKPVIAAEPEE